MCRKINENVKYFNREIETLKTNFLNIQKNLRLEKSLDRFPRRLEMIEENLNDLEEASFKNHLV